MSGYNFILNEVFKKDDIYVDKNLYTDLTEISYLEGHENCGLDIDDEVLVFKKAESFKGGWLNHWISFMNNFVNTMYKGIIEEDKGFKGFLVCFPELYWERFHFPYFVLEKFVSG